METRDVINFMAKGASGALIVMSPADLKGFADEVIKAEKIASAGKPRRRLRGLTAASEQGEIVQAILQVWPDTKTSVLAKALGVSKMWIYKLLKVDLSEVVDDEIDGETISEASKILNN